MPPLRRTFSGVSTEMRADNSDFLTGVGETYELQDSGALVARRRRGDSMDLDDAHWLDPEGGNDQLGPPSLVRVRSHGLSKAKLDRPPRLCVRFRLRELVVPVSTDTGAHSHTQHEHPVGLAVPDFAQRFPKVGGGESVGRR